MRPLGPAKKGLLQTARPGRESRRRTAGGAVMALAASPGRGQARPPGLREDVGARPENACVRARVVASVRPPPCEDTFGPAVASYGLSWVVYMGQFAEQVGVVARS